MAVLCGEPFVMLPTAIKRQGRLNRGSVDEVQQAVDRAFHAGGSPDHEAVGLPEPAGLPMGFPGWLYLRPLDRSIS
jgi:hypothetical protein